MNRAFSLLELLVVLAILAILAAFLVPAMNSSRRAVSLTGSTQAITGTLELARQTAATQNRSVEVRFYKLPEDGQPTGTPTDYRGLQIFLVDAGATNAIARPTRLSSSVIITDDISTSSLMDEAAFPEKPAAAGVNVPPVGSNYRYRSFYFRPDGSADLPSQGPWFLTLVSKNDPVKTNGLPANFATIQIEPMTGQTKVKKP